VTGYLLQRLIAVGTPIPTILRGQPDSETCCDQCAQTDGKRRTANLEGQHRQKPY